ncbi:redox-active disulfide protein 2 [Methanococcus vannielii SB]|uniref:Thioredoxin n=1 Tax=Methanococcus vannielii (strain ATCC 35089 / DSM 1224 / JCM 13029 / OCM 148 / SB) TaxID=406327 RepID=A6USV4_METVS|nr:thioredoxin family protein [Methanococcus vannielii]ABR55576.1 redox-active disulfide protein 2 [Methanococcus vannielii SB]
MDIKIFGTGCKKCTEVYKNVKKAVDELKINAEIVKVTDIAEISEYVMITPGIAVNEGVIFEGKVPGVEEIKEELSKLY